MKITFLLPYPVDEVPSQRFRFEQYLPMLVNKGFTISLYSFLSKHDYNTHYKSNNPIKRGWVLVKGIFIRWWILPRLVSADTVFIHREVSPVGPPIFEWIIAKLMHKKIIYDFDDAIWLTDNTVESEFENRLRWRTKIGRICSWSYKISCGNNYLANFARQFNGNVIINPTTIDTKTLHNPSRFTVEKTEGKIIIGWTGSHSTLKYLNRIESVLNTIQDKYSAVSFLVIADKNPNLNLKRIEFIHWNKDTEAADLLKIDIGIMPLPNDEWTKGKCGFKALQYMAMRIPCVVTPVGVNASLVEHEKTGYLASDANEWILYLEKLIDNPSIRENMGDEGRKKVINHYSVDSNTANFLSLFE